MEEGGGVWPRYTLKWWKDIVKLEEACQSRWFNSEVERKVGDGMLTSFWKDPWRGRYLFVLNILDFLLSLIVKRQKWVKLDEHRRMGKNGGFRGEGIFLCWRKSF